MDEDIQREIRKIISEIEEKSAEGQLHLPWRTGNA